MPTEYSGQFDYERCPKHPQRPIVDGSVCTKRYCAECVEQHKQNYANDRPGKGFRIQDERSADGRWIYDEMRGALRPRPEEKQ